MEEGLAGIPTAFKAVYGTGKPVIGFLGEYDALASMSQKACVSHKEPVQEGAPGHGCGHCNLGAGALAAAVATKDFMRERNMQGTVVYFGCPAEEAGCGKTFMARDGVFDCMDVALTWHPNTMNAVWATSSLSEIDVVFRFKGRTAHAAACPELGRSALDAAELMNVGVNYRKKARRGTHIWNVSVYNVYNAMTPNLVFMDKEVLEHSITLPSGKPYYWTEVKNHLKKVTLLPCIPSITYTFKF